MSTYKDKQKLEIPIDYYLDSVDKLSIEGRLYRTEGSAQLHFWRRCKEGKIPEDCISYRRYFTGRYKNERFFAKQFLEPYPPAWSIKRTVEYQFENLFLLKDLQDVPEPLFLTEDIVGMQYINGETIKNLCLTNRFSAIADIVIRQVQKNGSIIVNRLKKIGRGYDCSYNNILVKDNNRIVFVDFDYAEKPVTLKGLIRILEDLKRGVAKFNKNGEIYYEPGNFLNFFK